MSGRARALWLVLLVVCGAQASAEIRVKQLSADAVYLDAGSRAGLAVGQQLEVVRDGEVVALLRVEFVAGHSASCRVLEQAGEIAVGDRVLAPASEVEEPEPEPAAPPPAEPRTVDPQPLPKGVGRPARIHGSAWFDFESFRDGSDRALDHSRSAGGLTLRARNLGGAAYDLRLSVYGRRIYRERSIGAAGDGDTRERLRELVLIHEPPGALLSFRAGRMAVRPLLGLGYLDGVLGRIAPAPWFRAGAFFGTRPVVDSLALETARRKLGLFAQVLSGRSEVGLAAVRERGLDDVSREYVSLESRVDAGSRWSFRQHAEVDVHRGWRRTAAGTASQLSQLSLHSTARFTRRARLALSYSLREPYRTEETRFVPADRFDDLRRQGLSARLALGGPGRWAWAVHGGLRRRDDDADDTAYYGAGVRHPGLFGSRYSVSADLLGHSSRFTDGVLAILRAARSFRGGHSLHASLGANADRSRVFGFETSSHWARIGAWVELPARFFGRAELELAGGDDLEGARLTAGAGYRF